MISVETSRPVYSSFGGKDLTPEQKKERQKRRLEKAKQLYNAAKETGSLSAIENIAMRAGAPLTPTDTNTGGGDGGNDNDKDPKAKGWSSLSNTTKISIVGGSLLVVGVAVWYFGFRKAK
jgi:hypothetical protein